MEIKSTLTDFRVSQFCCYCGRGIHIPLKKTVEHLVPLSKGGNDSPHNKKSCCHKCNNWRGNKPLENFKNEVKELITYNKLKVGYNRQDLEAIVENIEYWQHYINTSRSRLLKSNYA